uniref:Uncharacterized protein n=1 Tax=Salix viminalis TaxID=40686 RepID=A0A6N2K3H8_SALVM
MKSLHDSSVSKGADMAAGILGHSDNQKLAEVMHSYFNSKSFAYMTLRKLIGRNVFAYNVLIGGCAGEED